MKTTPKDHPARAPCIGFAYASPLLVDLVLGDRASGFRSFVQDTEAPVEELVDFLRTRGTSDTRRSVVIVSSARELKRLMRGKIPPEGKRIDAIELPPIDAFVVCEDAEVLRRIPACTVLDVESSGAQTWKRREVAPTELRRALKGKPLPEARPAWKVPSLEREWKAPISAQELVQRAVRSLMAGAASAERKSYRATAHQQLLERILCIPRESVWTLTKRKLLANSEDVDAIHELDMFVETDQAAALRSAYLAVVDRKRSPKKAASRAGVRLEDLTFVLAHVPSVEGRTYHPPKTRKGQARVETLDDEDEGA